MLRRLSSLVLAVALGAVALLALWPSPGTAEQSASRAELNRSLEDPIVRRIRERWHDAPEPRWREHPPLNEIPEIKRDLEDAKRAREEKEARLGTTEERDKRRRSRVAYKGLRGDQAAELAQTEFAELFSDRDRRLLPLKVGQRVSRYTGQTTAVVEGADGADGASVVDSTLPLRARDESGELAPVDLDLERTSTGWVPTNGLVPVRIGARSGDALSLPESFSLAIGGTESTGFQTKNEVFFADVAQDTDAWLSPTPLGARLAFQLRSEDSPEELRLSLRDAPGVELSLESLPGGTAVEFTRAGQRLGLMSTPIAFDADDQPIDLDLRIDGAEIVIEVPHRELDRRYPLTVDPVYENQDSWKWGGNSNNAGWKYSQRGTPCTPGWTTWYAGTGFYLFQHMNQWYHNSDFCEYQYQAPNEYSYIHRADFLHQRHDSPNGQTATNQGMWSIYWGGFQHRYNQNYSYDAAGSYWSVCADGQAVDWACDEWVNVDQSRGNYVLSSITPNRPNWSYSTSDAIAYFGGARIWMSDWEPPGLWYFEPPPSGWVRDVPAGPYNGVNEVHVRYGDRGLGLWGIWMDVPGKPRQYSSDWGGCSGAHSSRCPETRAHNFSYAGMSEGVQTVIATGQDVLGRTTSDSRTLRIDRTPPALDFEGTLKPEDTGWVERGEQGLSLDATDSLSGVTHAELRIDGSVVEAADQSCGLSGGCSLDYDFAADTEAYSPGAHSVAVVARDQAGNTATREWSVKLERDAPQLSLSGSLREAQGQTLPEGSSYTLSVSSTDPSGTTSASGVRSIEVAVDDEEGDIVERACSSGGCSLTRQFTYVTDEYSSGPHEIRVTARDFAGNETTERFTVNNEDPRPPACPGPPPPDSVVNPQPVPPAEALASLQSSQGFRQAVEPWTPSSLDGVSIAPVLQQLVNSFNSASSLAEASFDTTPSDGVTATLGTEFGPICLTPTVVSIGASDPGPPVNGTAAVYANSHPATDTVARPTPTGLELFAQLRGPGAPTELSWYVATQPGQLLTQLSDGGVAVIEPAPPGSESPSAGDPVPGAPTTAQRQAAVTDAGQEMAFASDDLERYAAATPHELVAFIPKPWAKDALGRLLPTSLGVSGSVVTMTISHGPLTAQYPVVADPHVVSPDAVNDYEARKAVAGTPDYTDAEADAYQAPGDGAAAPVPGPAGDGTDGSEDPWAEPCANDVDCSAYSDDSGPADDSAVASATAKDPTTSIPRAQRQAVRDRLAALRVGLTESDPTVVDPGNAYRAELAPKHLRPIVAWKIVDMVDKLDDPLPSDPSARKRRIQDNVSARRWLDFYNNARPLVQQRRLTVDVAIARRHSELNSTTPPTVRTYGRWLDRFLDRYGSIVTSLSAWNEPNEVHDPLRRRPVRAAQLWMKAQELFRKRGKGQLVAGEFAGTIHERAVPGEKGRKKRRYESAYHNYLVNRVRKSRRPRVWGIHAYGDSRRYELLRGRIRFGAPILSRYYKRYRSSAYEYADAGDKRARPWVTAIGAYDRFGCLGINNPQVRTNSHNCGDPSPRPSPWVVEKGMAMQRDTIGFLLRKIAKDLPEITRLYYFNLHARVGYRYADSQGREFGSSGRCNRSTGRCPLDESGLIGADDDQSYAVVDRSRGPSDRSRPGERRLSFCLLRDHSNYSRVIRPGRVKRSNCAPN